MCAYVLHHCSTFNVGDVWAECKELCYVWMAKDCLLLNVDTCFFFTFAVDSYNSKQWAKHDILVVSTPLTNISQLGWLFLTDGHIQKSSKPPTKWESLHQCSFTKLEQHILNQPVRPTRHSCNISSILQVSTSKLGGSNCRAHQTTNQKHVIQ